MMYKILNILEVIFGFVGLMVILYSMYELGYYVTSATRGFLY